MPLQSVSLGPYRSGVNLVDPSALLEKDEASICQNFRLGIQGGFYKRPGHAEYGSSPAKINGNALVTLVARFYRSGGTKELLGAAGGKLKKGNDATGAWTPINIDGDAGNSMSSVNLADSMVYKNRIYIADGVKPHRYNGTDDVYAGHFIHAAPTTAPGLSGALTPNSTYKYFITSVTADMGEGPAGAIATQAISGGEDQIDLSVILAAPARHEEVSKRIYRTEADGDLYFLLTEIPTGTTDYSDLIADSNLGSEHVPTHIPPADARFCIIGHDDRAYWFGRAGANASLVDVSEVGFPDRIINADFFSVANNDGDILTGGGLVPGGLVFLKRSSMWLLRAFGFGLINIQPKDKRAQGAGTTSPFSVVYTPAGLIFLSQRGEIYKFDGTNLSEIGRRIATEFYGMSETSLGYVVACYHDYRYIVSYDWRSQKGYNWKTLEYDIRTGKWEGPHENGVFYTPSYYSVWDSVRDKGELYWGESRASTGSYVYGRSEFSKTDRGTKFLSRLRSGALPIAELGEFKTTKAFIHGTVSVDASLSITHIDETGTRLKTNLGVTSPVTAGKYNISKYNQAKYGGIPVQVLEASILGARARTPTYEISDGGTATEVNITLIKLLGYPLPLK
jgi:hypothetical protein